MTTGVVAAALVAGCGPMGDAGIAGRLVQDVLPAAMSGTLTPQSLGAQPSAAASAQQQTFSPEAIAADPGNYMAFDLRTVAISALGVRAGRNGDEVTYFANTGFSVTLEEGLLVATRGLGQDLMAADVSGVRAALARGGGSAQRVHEILDSRDQVVRQTFDCTIVATGVESIDLGTRTIQALRFEETCTGETASFVNLYWLDGSSTIMQSRQLVSPTVAYLRSNRL